MKKNIILFLLMSFSSINGFSQSVHTVDSIETAYHNCLDKRTFMLDCSKEFYNKMDSMLNVIYGNLMHTCNEIQRKNLKTEQKEWLIKRNSYFQKTLAKQEKETKGEGFVPQDNEMFRIDNNASFVKERVVQLLKAKNKDYSTSLRLK
jgi:uncharacterized protein YecT (DUF1311 family)